MIILAAIFLGAILINGIEDDAGNALMRRYLLYGSLDQLARRRRPLNNENGLIRTDSTR